MIKKTTTTKETNVSTLEEAKHLIDLAFANNEAKNLKGVVVFVYEVAENGVDVKFTWAEPK